MQPFLQPFIDHHCSNLSVINQNKQEPSKSIFLSKSVVNKSAWNNPCKASESLRGDSLFFYHPGGPGTRKNERQT